jgi:hypothetical protein
MTKALTPAQGSLIEALDLLIENASEEDRNTLELALNDFAHHSMTEWRTASPLLRGLLDCMAAEVCDQHLLRQVQGLER